MPRLQVAANLIYGQVKKCYRQRKLVRFTPVMRLGILANLRSPYRGWVFRETGHRFY